MNRNTLNYGTGIMNNTTSNKTLKNKKAILGTVIFGGLLFIGMLLYIYYDELATFRTQQDGILIDGTINFENKDMRKYERRENIATLIGTRGELFEKGDGYGLTFIWDMNIPNTMGNKGWESNYNNMRPIMQWGESPHIYYNHRKNYLSFMVKYKDNPYYSQKSKINVEIPLQKWNRIIMVINGRKIVIFLNGIMVNTQELGNVPMISNNYLDIVKIGESNNNIFGKVRDMKVIFRPLRTNEILLA